MKKLLLIVFSTILLSGAQAQVIFEETFSAGVIPVPGWSIMGNQSNFTSPQTSLAGGNAPELQIINTPPFPVTTMRITSPQINTTGATQLIIRFKHRFEKMGATAFTLLVETRTGSGSWNNVWTNATTTTIDAETVVIAVSNANVGASNFQFSFAFNGNSQSMKNWSIDNVEVLKPLALDGAISSVDLPALFVGEQEISGKFSNLGTTPLNSIDVNWRVDEGEVHTTSYTGLNLALGASGDYVSDDNLNLPAGDYDLFVWISNVNGLPADDNTSNDTLTKELSIPTQLIFYKPLFEEFTSSTCAPCASFNNGTFNPFLAQHTDDELTLIKYQMNWPGSGDPYYTPEGGVRRTFYGVNAVPDLYIDGKKVGTTTAAINTAFNATAGNTCFVGIEATHEIQGNNVIIDASIVPFASYGNVKIHMAIVEVITTQNVASNGETEFHHVMMKMVPDANGTSVSLVAGQNVELKHTINMSSTNVEEMDDLMVAIFIQESNKNILQSGYSTEVGATITSSISDSAINVPVAEPITVNFSQAIRMIGGAPITDQNVASIIDFREGNANGIPAGFTATINAAKTQITITPNPSLKYVTRYTLNILPVENNSSVPTVNYVITFTTLLNIGVIERPMSQFNLFPNPANNTLYINNVENINQVEIYSIVGNIVKTVNVQNISGQLGINVSNLPSGIYFMKAKGIEREKTVKFVISR